MVHPFLSTFFTRRLSLESLKEKYSPEDEDVKYFPLKRQKNQAYQVFSIIEDIIANIFHFNCDCF
jgi:hypothetical protein